jgi:hypothetical protein
LFVTVPSSRIFTRRASKSEADQGIVRWTITPLNDGVGRLQRPGLPGGDLLENGVCDHADEIRRDVQPVEIADVGDDLPHAHAARVNRDDLVVEVGEAPLELGQLRIEARSSVPGHVEADPAVAGQHGLAPIAIATVVGAALAGEMVVHLRVQRPLCERLLQAVDQAVALGR